MNQKNAEYIALYSLVFGVILVFGILIRQFVLSKGIDDFSSTVAFFATVIVLTALYASLQITFNQFLLPRIEAFLLRFSAFQTMKNHNDTVSVKKRKSQRPCIVRKTCGAKPMLTGHLQRNQLRRESQSGTLLLKSKRNSE